MMYSDQQQPPLPQQQQQFQQQQQPPPQPQQFQQPPPLHPPLQPPQPGFEFHRGMPMPMPMPMRPPPPGNFPPDYANPAVPPPFDAHGDNFGARRIRKLVHRKAVDYTSTVVRYTQNLWTFLGMLVLILKISEWTPSGRRLITGSQSGEFTLWNGQSFNFEMILQAHDQAIRSMVWSHNENWMVTGDDGGSIKYWQNNMNNVKANKSAHNESVRDLSSVHVRMMQPSKFGTLHDAKRSVPYQAGHGGDVKSVDWHPTKSLLVSGGKDYLVKLWDAKSGKELCSFHGHKNIVLCVKWNQNGNWVLTAGKDQIIKLYDIRAMKELESFRGHRKDVTALAWHPFHEEYFVSGSFDGAIFHWLAGYSLSYLILLDIMLEFTYYSQRHETPQVEITNAHENSVWDLDWHPIGYILCSGSNDHTTRFWCRNRPGDPARDKFTIGYNQGYGEQNPAFGGRPTSNFSIPEPPTTPGPFSGGLTRNEGTIPGIGVAMPLSLDASDQGEQRPPLAASMPIGAPPLPPGPHPSLLASGQQTYQQIPQQMPPHQQPHVHPQQMSFPRPPPNMPPLQPPHLPHLPHPHMPRPPPQLPPVGMPSTIPMPGSMPMSMPLPMPGSMGMQNPMAPPLPQGHHMGLNPMHSAPMGSNSMQPPSGGYPNGKANMQGPSGATGGQMYQPGGAFNRGPPGQLPMVSGLHAYQSGSPGGPGMGPMGGGHMGLPSGLPPPPPPHGSGNQTQPDGELARLWARGAHRSGQWNWGRYSVLRVCSVGGGFVVAGQWWRWFSPRSAMPQAPTLVSEHEDEIP
ncbi:hypothetical protein Sjap_002173 [Stephania japonica]|uniref:Flowering time control protein FY n=1 Tax=Stephania japonica TaxID=461633 RepID=A0AAP0KLE1_9MAGN